MKTWPIAIDPAGCGCTECITGEYMPANLAEPKELFRLVRGEIGNNTGFDLANPAVQEAIGEAVRKAFSF